MLGRRHLVANARDQVCAHTRGAAAKAALACPARLSVNLDALFNNTTSGLSAHLSKHVTIPSGFSDDYTAKEIANA